MNTVTTGTASTAKTAGAANTANTANTPDVEITVDSAAAARHERFGKLPERVPYQDMVEVRPASPNESARDAYDPEGSWMSFSCLAADLGL